MTPWTRAHQASLSFIISQCLLKLMSIESVMLSNHLILCCSQYFPASGSFPMSQIFVSEGQIIGASASVLPMNIQGWFPLGLSGLMSLQPKGLSRVFSSTTIQKHQFFGCSAFIMWTQPLLWSHPYMTTGKTIAWTILTFVSTLMSLIFNTLSRFVIVFLLRNKHLLISWLLSLSTVIFSLVQFSYSVLFDSLWPHGLQHASHFRAQEKKICPWFHFSPSLCCEVMELDAIILVFSTEF